MTTEQGLSHRLMWRLALLRAPQPPVHVAHLQFKHPNAAHLADQRLRNWIGGLASLVRGRVDYFAAAEPNADGDGVHLHCLLWGTGAHPSVRLASKWRCGSVRLEPLRVRSHGLDDDPTRYPDPDDAAEALSSEQRLLEEIASARGALQHATLLRRGLRGQGRRGAREEQVQLRKENDRLVHELSNVRKYIGGWKPDDTDRSDTSAGSPLVWQVLYTTKLAFSSETCFFSRTLRHKLSKPARSPARDPAPLTLPPAAEFSPRRGSRAKWRTEMDWWGGRLAQS